MTEQDKIEILTKVNHLRKEMEGLYYLFREKMNHRNVSSLIINNKIVAMSVTLDMFVTEISNLPND